jgi:hypothetical protein
MLEKSLSLMFSLKNTRLRGRVSSCLPLMASQKELSQILKFYKRIASFLRTIYKRMMATYSR